VTLVDRHDEANVGGLARMAFGGMALVDTPIQRRMGVKDSPTVALADWRSFAEFPDDDTWPKAWAEAYVEQSAERVFHGSSVGTSCPAIACRVITSCGVLAWRW
jgi:predicted oxidoreductase